MLNRHQVTVLLFSVLILALFASIPAPVSGGANLGHQIYAIPAFSRQYGTSCSTCHVDFPKLNDFGKAFKDAGFKFPKDDETFIKVPPVMLGSPAQKELWPHTIWPGTIPGLPPVGLRFNTFLQVVGRNRNNFNLQTPGDPTAPFIPRTDFQSGLFSIFMAGNFGDDIAFWVDDDISVGGSGAAGGLGDGYLKFVNIGRHLKLPTDALTLRVGQFELDLPFSPARSWNLSGWDIYDQANINTVNSALGAPSVSNSFAMSNAAQGVEFSGGHSYRGYHYSLAIVNQNTGGARRSGITFRRFHRKLPIRRTPTSKTSTAVSPTALTWSVIRPAATRFRRRDPPGLAIIPISTWGRSTSTDVPCSGFKARTAPEPQPC